MLFNSLTKSDLFKIIDIQLEDLKNNLIDKNNTLQFSKTAKEFLIRDGAHREWGARPLRRLIQNEVENKISNKFIKGEIKNDKLVTVKAKGGLLVFTQFPKPSKKTE